MVVLSSSRTRRNRNLFALGGGIGSLLGVVYLGGRYFRAAGKKQPPQYPQFSEEEEAPDPTTPPQDPQFYEDEQKYIDTDDEEEEEPEEEKLAQALNTAQEIAQEVLPAAQAQQVAQAADAIAQVAEKVSSPKERQVVQAAAINLVNKVAAAVEVAEAKPDEPPSPEAIPVLRQRRLTRSSQQKPATPRVIPGPIPDRPRVIALETVVLAPGQTVTKLADVENQTILSSLENYFTKLVGALIDVAANPVEQQNILFDNLQYYDDKEELIRKNLEKYLLTPGMYKKEIRQANADLAARMLITKIIRDTLLPMVQKDKMGNPVALRAFLGNFAVHLPRKLKLVITEYQGLFPGGINGFRDWFERFIWNIPAKTFTAAAAEIPANANLQEALPEKIKTILQADELKNGMARAATMNALLRKYFQAPNRPVADIETERAMLKDLKKPLKQNRDKYFPAELAGFQKSGTGNLAELMEVMMKNQLQLQILDNLRAQFKELGKNVKAKKVPLMGPMANLITKFTPQALQNLLVPAADPSPKKSPRYKTRSRR